MSLDKYQIDKKADYLNLLLLKDELLHMSAGKFWGEERKVHKGSMTGPIETLTFDEAYFYDSIKNPMGRISDGAKAPMVFAFPTSDEEIAALMAYVKSLSE